jgi:hypothetical protein
MMVAPKTRQSSFQRKREYGVPVFFAIASGMKNKELDPGFRRDAERKQGRRFTIRNGARGQAIVRH